MVLLMQLEIIYKKKGDFIGQTENCSYQYDHRICSSLLNAISVTVGYSVLYHIL